MASSSRALYLFIFSLALCHSVNAGMSNVEKIQLAFKQITTASDNLRKETQLINIINAPLQGSKIAEGFAKIISAIAEYTIKINEGGVKNYNSPLPDADAQIVVQSLTTFVQVHQALLNVVIGKHGLLTLIPFFEPIRLSLVSLEATIDAFAFALIAEIPTQKPDDVHLIEEVLGMCLIRVFFGLVANLVDLVWLVANLVESLLDW